MKKNNRYIANIIISAILIGVAVTWRIINHNYALVPNLEIVTAASVLAALMIGVRGAIAVPLITMIISDLIIGNSSIFMFTWGSFALIGFMATLLRKFKDKAAKQIIGSFGFAIFSSFLFFLVTNLGVWLQGWYPMTFAGLATCFTLAIPFYRTMLLGNMLIIPAVTAIWQIVKAYKNSRASNTVASGTKG